MITRGSYVHKPMVKFLASKISFLFLKILMVSTKQFTGLLEIIKLYKTKPFGIREFFLFFIIYPPKKLYLGFKMIK